MTTRLLLGYLALLSALYAYLLTGPVGACLYAIGLAVLLLAAPIQRSMAYKMELAEFHRDMRIAQQRALQLYRYSYGGAC